MKSWKEYLTEETVVLQESVATQLFAKIEQICKQHITGNVTLRQHGKDVSQKIGVKFEVNQDRGAFLTTPAAIKYYDLTFRVTPGLYANGSFLAGNVQVCSNFDGGKYTSLADTMTADDVACVRFQTIPNSGAVSGDPEVRKMFDGIKKANDEIKKLLDSFMSKSKKSTWDGGTYKCYAYENDKMEGVDTKAIQKSIDRHGKKVTAEYEREWNAKVAKFKKENGREPDPFELLFADFQ